MPCERAGVRASAHKEHSRGEYCAETVRIGNGAREENRLLAVSPLPRRPNRTATGS